MKNLTTGVRILLVMIGLFSTMIAQEWVQQTSNTFESLSGIYMFNETEGWVCGDGGTLLHTVDGGVNWSPIVLSNED
ncbi:MAG: hypothetical protein KDH97_03520, partial [Calditrichaeota bacterium]|nr:hypothetical protein [Calditrichota bacterium]